MLLNPNVLDITEFTEKGIDLQVAIQNAVQETQRVIIRELPNVIRMTQAQYDNLIPYDDMSEMFGSQGFYMYRTPLNVMEVEIKK